LRVFSALPTRRVSGVVATAFTFDFGREQARQEISVIRIEKARLL